MRLRQKNPLLDKNFLIELDHYHEKEVWAKIIALDINENPTEEITGRITSGGSINVDGTSAVRRSCSLSMVAKDVNINDFYWGLHSKFKLLIGLTNKINSEYPDIIWFPQGVYLITSFSTSQSTNSYNISIQGKDKMCLLNGEIGGTLTAPIDFGKIEERDEKGNLTISDIPIKEIIKEGVHEYAKEPWHNIIINDLDDFGIELLEYTGSRPLYMIIDEATSEVINITMNQNFPFKTLVSGKLTSGKTENIIGNIDEKYLNKLTEFYNGSDTGYAQIILNNGKLCSIAKIEYGQTAGYRLTDITYAGDLIANQGDSLTSILDKIVQMLGQFEYFYDIDGRFIFQKKKTYIQTTWNNLITTSEGEVIADLAATPYGYEFSSNDLAVSFSNSPNLNDLKNDFSIWGVRKSTSGAEIPVHLRYAIDKKPFYYKSIETGKVYISDLSLYEEEKVKVKNQIITEIGEAIMNFDMTYGLKNTGLQKPIKNDDGSWTPGWWDIRDWYEFYYLLKQEYPNKTMKWYSQNTLEGAPLVSSIPNYEQKVDPYYQKPDYRCWLIIESKKTGNYNLQHGAGDPSSPEELERCYYSYIDENGKIQTVRDTSEPDQYFMMPYCGCNEKHTYLEFIRTDINQGNNVYFYNPKFPSVDSFKEIVSKRIEVEYEELIKSGKLQLCDWREIIYQMAKDYRKHNHDDDFLINVRENNTINGKYLYPTGYTGYEQYYIDMEGFWRQLYNPNYKVDDKKLNLGGDGPIETEIQINEWGGFNGVPIEEVYIYPLKPITDKDAVDEDSGEKLYTPEHSFVVTDIGERCNVKTFLETVTLVNDKNKPYFIHYTNQEKPTEVTFAMAKSAYIGSLLIKEGNDYIRYIDKLFENADNLYYQSKDYEKLISLKDNKLYYNSETNTFWPSYYNEKPIEDGNGETFFDQTKITFYHTTYNYIEPDFDEDGELINKQKAYWHKNVWDAPQLLNFWFDFMDTSGEMNKYSVPVVGSRPKVINNTSIKSIYFRETPTVIFINKSNIDGWNHTERKSGYTYIHLPDSMLSLFKMSGQGKSAQNTLEECIYNDTYCVESASMNTIPIYYLQPNTRIYIRDDNSKIDGEYMVSRFTIPLSYNGTMSISATKIADRIY